MANDGTVRIGTELDESGFREGLTNLDRTASKLFKAGAAAVGSITAAATGAVAGLSALEEATEEYRIAQGKLNTAFESAGYSIETAQGVYKNFYEILGDTDTATEASQLLAKLSNSQEDLSKWTNIAAGVWGTFGDSLPIESMIEAANETAKTGSVVGTLADALNWAGISEDEFNKKLEAAGSEAKRNQLIMETLSATYSDAADAFYKNNDVLIKSRDAQAELDAVMAKLGEQASITKTEIMTGLTPALEGLVENVDWEKLGSAIADFVSAVIDNGPTIISIIGGIGAGFAAWKITTVIQGAVSSISSLVTALTTATAAQTGLNAAMAVNPIGLLAAAIGTVVGIVGAYSAAATIAGESTKSLSAEVESARKEYEQLSTEIAENQTSTLSQISTLQQLVEQENKTAAQKESIKKLVDDLNESVPELSLAYDEQADSLNMTTEAIKAAAQAELERAKQQAAIDRLTEAYQEQIEIAEELEKAQAELEKQEKRYAEAADDSAAKTTRQKDQMYAYEGALIGAQGEVDRLTELQDKNAAEIAELEAAYGQYANVTLEEARKASIELVNQSGKETVAINATTAAIKAKLQALLAAAQAESKGSASALAQSGFDPVTIALNSAKYVKSQAEIKAYTDAIISLEKAEADAAQTAKDLNEAVYAGSGGTGSSSTSKAVTQAEKNLEAYEDAVKQLDHQRAMDLISEEEYYKQKNALGAKYLKEGSDEQMALEEELYEWEKRKQEEVLKAKTEAYEAQRDALKNAYEDQEITTEEYLSELNRIQSEYLDEGTEDWVEAVEFRNSEVERLNEEFYEAFTDSLDSIGDRYSDAISEIESAQQSLADKLANTGELFETVDDSMHLADLQDSIDQIKEYGDALNQLRERGISESLLGEVLAMDTEEATSYMGKLLSMTDKDFEEYNALWEEKQRLARDIAEQFYSDQIDVLETEFTDELSGALSEVPETMETIGRDAVQAWIQGFQAEQGAAIDAVRAFQEALNRASGSVSAANASMTPAASTAPQNATETAITQAAGMMAMAASAGGSREVVFQVNGTEFARAIIPDMRAVEDQSPRIVSD